MPLLILFVSVVSGAIYFALRAMENQSGNEQETPPMRPTLPDIPLDDPEATIPETSAPEIPPEVAPAPVVAGATLYDEIGARYGVDPLLLRAVVITESSENPDAENLRDPSVGLGQVLCKFDPADPQRKCLNRLNVNHWEGATWYRLKDPRYNLTIASQVLAWNLRNYGFPKGIAVYNDWSARDDGAQGPFRNQKYVDKVLSKLAKLKGNA